MTITVIIQNNRHHYFIRFYSTVC